MESVLRREFRDGHGLSAQGPGKIGDGDFVLVGDLECAQFVIGPGPDVAVYETQHVCAGRDRQFGAPQQFGQRRVRHGPVMRLQVAYIGVSPVGAAPEPVLRAVASRET